MTTSDTDQIRERIERTRASLAENVDALADQANPVHMAERKIGRIKAGADRFFDRILGTADDAGHAVNQLGSQVGDTANDVAQNLGAMPRAAEQQVRGNPMAAGAVAFGVGLLLAAAFPPSASQTRLAADVKRGAEGLAEPAMDALHQVADNLSGPAQQMAADLGASASQALGTVVNDGKAAVSEVTGVDVGATPDADQSR